jgi:hypothetical protein
MCAVILIFAFTMSLVINLVEKTIAGLNEDETQESKTGEAFAAEKQE